MRFAFVKQTSMLLSKTFDISTAAAFQYIFKKIYWKSLTIRLDVTVGRSAVDWQDLKLESHKKAPFLTVIKEPIIYKFFKDFTNNRK